jgi:hypothetical protein
MHERRPPRHPGIIDLIAFLAVLTTGVFFVALRINATTIAAVAAGLSTLFTTWARSAGAQPLPPTEPPTDETEAAQPGQAAGSPPR